jgi:3,4-dihydroxy 2-butanone 4-phosphate synthase/GTP cyclohydrolase II
MKPFFFSSIEQAVTDLKRGKMIILVDDIHRENEGDFVMAAQFATDKHINKMITDGKGLVCAPIELNLAKKLNLPLMVAHNTDDFRTAFTISIDAQATSTGISAAERALTLTQLANPQVNAKDFKRPGHMFPLIGKPGGLQVRQGHTEASLYLMALAGLRPVAVICEIILPNGKMARRPQLKTLAKKWRMPLLAISQLTELLQGESR